MLLSYLMENHYPQLACILILVLAAAFVTICTVWMLIKPKIKD
jgi:hypothetical protein